MTLWPYRAALAMTLCVAAQTVPIRAQVQGIVEPLSVSCELETHRITDPCSGAMWLARSASIDLNAYACRHVSVTGTEVGSVCPSIVVQTVVEGPPSCVIEVGGVALTAGDSGTVLRWARVPCAESYDVIRGVLGVPLIGACVDPASCPFGYYCDKLVGDCSGVGQCKPKPIACAAVYLPVCGCDGMTYSNSCHAAEEGVPVACYGLCPCPAACPSPGTCLDEGPVVCYLNDIRPASAEPSLGPLVTPPVGQAHFYLVRAKGSGIVGVTTYGFTSDGRERLFEGDCPR